MPFVVELPVVVELPPLSPAAVVELPVVVELPAAAETDAGGDVAADVVEMCGGAVGTYVGGNGGGFGRLAR
jgi:hypothetical protein